MTGSMALTAGVDRNIDYARLFEAAPTPYLVLDPDLVILEANHAYLQVTGRDRDELVGSSMLDVVPADEECHDVTDDVRTSLERARDRGEPDVMAVRRYRIPLGDGGFIEREWSPTNVPVLDDDGKTVLLLHRIVDVTDLTVSRNEEGRDAGSEDFTWEPGDGLRRRVAEVEAALLTRVQELERVNRELREARDQLASRALHDPLTGLLVRTAFLEQLSHALARLARRQHSVAVLFIDLDRLKPVNDQHGHAAGDELIRRCAERLRSGVRPSDAVGRIGGDEFVVLLDDLRDEEEADAVAERLLEDLSVPCRLGPSLVVYPGASIGVAVTADDRMSADTMVAHADAAMYRAKQSGRRRFERFDETAYRAAGARRQLESQLEAALSAGELLLHYQPIVDLTTGHAYAAEALLRWQHPTRGLLTAASFIDVAEETGLMVELGHWAIRQACRQLADWDAELGDRSPERMFVNLSVTELAQAELREELRDIIAAAGIEASRIVLEITERGVVDERRTAGNVIDMLQDLGCELAIDDFGTGYSSLSRLVQLPVDVLKVDRTFVSGVSRNRESAAIVSAVLLLGQNLRKRVVAEGVEDDAALTTLRELGCSYAQGFRLARPQPAEQLADRLRYGALFVDVTPDVSGTR